MTQSDALQQAAARLNAAVDALENLLDQLTADADPVSALGEQVAKLTQERDRLLQELESERKRSHRLEAANDEVSGRLETLMVTLRHMIPPRLRGAGLEL